VRRAVNVYPFLCVALQPAEVLPFSLF
jgi:hypothetical protein